MSVGTRAAALVAMIRNLDGDFTAQCQIAEDVLAKEREMCADIAREHACQTWSECCNCGGEIARAIMQPRTED